MPPFEGMCACRPTLAPALFENPTAAEPREIVNMMTENIALKDIVKKFLQKWYSLTNIKHSERYL
jgi:hypothetical protein